MLPTKQGGMASKTKRVDAVPVGRLFLALDNPRFEPVEAESKAIEELCTKENVYPLARDIVKYGINPLENLALVPVMIGPHAVVQVLS
jgi:hypothetical protein